MTSSILPDPQNKYEARRESMVRQQLESRGISNISVLNAMRSVPRELFVPQDLQTHAYEDRPLPVGHGQTISQPYTVALMCEALKLTRTDRVLEIGTGTGYAACVLSKLCLEVHTIERIAELAHGAQKRLSQLGFDNICVHIGDGTQGWPENAPFDAIVATAGGPLLPPAFVEQLAEGGRIVMPIGPVHGQTMFRFSKHQGALISEKLGAFSFVPLIGTAGWPDGCDDPCSNANNHAGM